MMLWEGDVETVGLLVEFVVFVIVIGRRRGECGGVEECYCRDDGGVDECHCHGGVCDCDIVN